MSLFVDKSLFCSIKYSYFLKVGLCRVIHVPLDRLLSDLKMI